MSWDGYLKDKLKKYPHKEPAKTDALNALRSFQDLKPEFDTYVYNDGKQQQLVSLKGTIPVRYRGSVYNIPVCIWLLETHPYIPPLVYVRPTSSMVIKPGRHVDNNGRVYLPYLTEWRHPQSELCGLIQVLCMTFGEDPPVYSKSAPQPSRPPYPSGGFPQPGTQSHATPYPSQPGGMPMPMPNPMYGGSSGARPPYPPSTGSSMPPYPSSISNSRMTPYPASTGSSSVPAPYPASSSQSMPPYSSSNYPGSSPQPPYPSAGRVPPYSAAQQTSSTQSSSQPQKSISDINRQASITDEAVRASLLSGVEDKLKRRIQEVYEQAKIEINGLQKTKYDLENGSKRLNDILEKLKEEQNNVDANIQLLEQKNSELKQLIEKLESDADKMDIDEAVVTTTPLYNQILGLFAEENAVEDAIYYLGEALRREVIDLEVFLKNVRSLSRQQFLLRAQLKKARQTAGLSEMSVH